jgi:hypothetical protein
MDAKTINKKDLKQIDIGKLLSVIYLVRKHHTKLWVSVLNGTIGSLTIIVRLQFTFFSNAHILKLYSLSSKIVQIGRFDIFFFLTEKNEYST